MINFLQETANYWYTYRKPLPEELPLITKTRYIFQNGAVDEFDFSALNIQLQQTSSSNLLPPKIRITVPCLLCNHNSEMVINASKVINTLTGEETDGTELLCTPEHDKTHEKIEKPITEKTTQGGRRRNDINN